MLVNWNLLVSAVKLANFERVTCSFVGVTCSFEAVTCSFDVITFHFVIPKWWILQHIYSGGNSIEEGGGGEQSFANFRKFVLVLHIFLITCPKRSLARSTFSDLQGSVDTICKKSFLSFPYFSVVIKKYAKSKLICWKFAKLFSPPPPHLFNWISATVYRLQYSSFWNHKAKSYGIKTTSYAHKATSYAFKTYKYILFITF